MKRSGIADLPLHYGKVPAWLYERMASLGRSIVEVILMDYGKDEVLRRLADPFWFQSFGAVLGMDWHSSGITTAVMGALKRAINPDAKSLGLYICGGKGKLSMQTPQELLQLSDRIGLDGNGLIRSSKLVAKVDNTAIQDGYQLYLHNFIVTDQGNWSVVQQGMHEKDGTARRYHWHSEKVKSFVEEPHAGISGPSQGIIFNLTAAEISTDHIEFERAEVGVRAQIDRFLKIKGSKTVDYFHKTLGKILYDYCGLARNEKGLRYAIEEINRLKQEFYKDVIVSGDANTLNTELEKAGRVADYFEIGELMCYDALTRNESCGAHFREEYQTADGEALRNDAEYQFISAWAWKGEGQEPELIREPLIFEEIQPTVRSYK